MLEVHLISLASIHKMCRPRPGDSATTYLGFIKKVYVNKAFYVSKEQLKKEAEKRAAIKKAKAGAWNSVE